LPEFIKNVGKCNDKSCGYGDPDVSRELASHRATLYLKRHFFKAESAIYAYGGREPAKHVIGPEVGMPWAEEQDVKNKSFEYKGDDTTYHYCKRGAYQMPAQGFQVV